jgi:hypothetical protein
LEIGQDVLWTFLEGLLNGPEGLDRIAVTGGRVSGMMATGEISQLMSLFEKLHGKSDAVSIMAQCVGGEKYQKVVAWETTNKQVTLQVINVSALTKTEREPSLAVFKFAEKLLPTGLCLLSEYEKWQDRVAV